MKVVYWCFGWILILCSTANAQKSSRYKDRVAIIHSNIYKEFYNPATNLFLETNDPAHNERPHSFLWPVCALIQGTNEMEELEPKKKYMQPVIKAIEQYYNTKPPAPGYQAYVVKESSDDRFYDDNQWIAIAYLDAYHRNKNKQLLKLSEEIYRFMLTGYDEVSGGGIYWKEGDKTTKNTCSNGPGILIALQLYKITKEKKYLDTAKLLYDWTNKYLLSPEGVYYDNVRLPSLKIDSAVYTYNTGTMLQSNVLFYRLTGDKKYLDEARRIAKLAEKYFYKNNRLPNNYWFNAVMLRGYVELYEVDKDPKLLQFIIDDADRIWEQERDSNNLLGRRKVKSLIDQAGMLEIYARIAKFKGEK